MPAVCVTLPLVLIVTAAVAAIVPAACVKSPAVITVRLPPAASATRLAGVLPSVSGPAELIVRLPPLAIVPSNVGVPTVTVRALSA